MPRASNDTTPVVLDVPPVQFRATEIGDGYIVSFNHYRIDSDPADLFRGLPDDRCQCPHWGYVLSGKLTQRFADHSEIYEAGDAYYTPPGHVPLMTAGTTLVEFSPAADAAKTDEVIERNMEAGVQAR